MPSDAALAIVGSVSVGLAGVAASIVTVTTNIRANKKLTREGVRREAYAHFLSVEAKAFSSCVMRRSAGCSEDPARQAEIEQSGETVPTRRRDLTAQRSSMAVPDAPGDWETTLMASQLVAGRS
jgi:hypothetical protein